jgi:hypothetical protein
MLEHEISRIPSHIHIQTKFTRLNPLNNAKVMKFSNALVGRVQIRNCKTLVQDLTMRFINSAMQKIRLDPFQTRLDNKVYNVTCTTLVQETMQCFVFVFVKWFKVRTKVTNKFRNEFGHGRSI